MNSVMQPDPRTMMPQQPQQQQQNQLDGLNANFFNNFPQMKGSQQQKVIPRFQSMGQDALLGPQGQQMNLNNFSSSQPLPLGMDSSISCNPSQIDEKRKLVPQDDLVKPIKKQRIEEPVQSTLPLDVDESNAPAPVPASKEGLAFFEDNDVLSGRGGGTNVHPGNRNFRDLINLHRRAYLKARKNDKPAISRAIVRSIRETGGRFLKKEEKTGLWLEIGDDAAREKTSQALRQRAPEMRKLLFDTEREEARHAAEEHFRQQRLLMGGMGQNMGMNQGIMGQGMNGMNSMNGVNAMNNSNGMNSSNTVNGMNNMNMNMNMNGMNDMNSNGMMNPALIQAMTGNKNVLGSQQANTDFSQMFSAAILQNGINRFASNGA